MRMTSWIIAVVAMLAAWTSPGLAQTGSPPNRPDIRADLLVGGHDPSDPGSVWLGIRVRLGPGWKTYWRSAGDGGLPPELDWTKSNNIGQPEVLWPAPHRMEILGVETIGYKEEVVLPVKARLKNPTAASTVSLGLTLYACSTVCVRDEHTLTTAVEPHASHPDQQVLIDAWRGRVPSTSSETLSVSSIRVLEGTPPLLRVEATSFRQFATPDLFVESDPPVFGSKPQVEVDPNGTGVFTITLEGETPETLRDRSFTVTLVDGERALEAASEGKIAQPETQQAAEQEGGSLWFIGGVALIGGLVLNLMPCVFPVLSLKLLAFVKQDGARLRAVRTGFAASAAGIMASFLVLASAMVILKSMGGTVGWGIQFQQPIFLAAMAAVLALFAANLLGLFEIMLPSRWMDRLDRMGRGTSLSSHFGSGFVATLLATPCSAPFVGTAVGFALARGAGEIYFVFGALGLGMALPYLLLVAVPRLATMLPRPGRWMLVAKQVMGLGVLATAAWLLTVIGTLAGLLTALAGATLLAIILAGLWLRQQTSGRFESALLLAVFLIPAAAAVAAFGIDGTSSKDENGVPWQSFDERAIRSLVGEGRTVLVDVTAAWCVTCKVNKALVLDSSEVKDRLRADVVPMQGNWTKPDERIAAYLQTFGRYGIPFNVVYGPGAPNGVVLPELLSKGAVLNALTKAASRS